MGDDNASATLKFAIGLVITMIVIAVVVVAFSFARSHANSAITSMSRDTSQIEESRYTQYDGQVVTGAEVLNIISKFEADDIYIGVQVSPVTTDTSTLTDQSKGTTTYILTNNDGSGVKNDTAAEADLMRRAKNNGDATYINPSSQFYGIINRNPETNAIIGISFFRMN